MPPIDMKKGRKNDIERAIMAFSLKLIGKVLAIIALPIVVFSWICRLMHVHLASKSAQCQAFAILLAFLVSSVTLCLKAISYGEEYELLTAVDEEQDKPPPRGTDAMS